MINREMMMRVLLATTKIFLIKFNETIVNFPPRLIIFPNIFPFEKKPENFSQISRKEMKNCFECVAEPNKV